MLQSAGRQQDRRPDRHRSAPHRRSDHRRHSDFEDHETPDQEANPNGNSVSLEQEMIKVSDTQAQFQAAANLYAKAMTLMKTAIGQP